MRLINLTLYLILTFAAATGLAAGDQCARVVDPILPVHFAQKGLDGVSDLKAMMARVREHAIPNSKYAHEHPDKGYAEVAKIAFLKHAYLAVFNHTNYMNLALGRIATFQTQNRIMTDQALTKENSQVLGYAGDDLPKDLFKRYLKVFPGGISKNAESALLNVERDFWKDAILPLREKDPEAILIAVGQDYMPGQTISHETLHAHFYEKPQLQKVVDTFWKNELSNDDRDAIVAILKREKYDTNNHEQMINEFLAYTLETGKAQILTPKLKKTYEAPLRSAIKAAGIELPALVPPSMR